MVFRVGFTLLLVLMLGSCSDEAARGLGLRTLPNSFGEINQVVVVADEELWNSAIGDTIRYYYGAAFPILPQPEPIYDLVHFTVSDLIAEPSRKEFRNYLIVANLEEEGSPTGAMILEDVGTEKVERVKSEPKLNSTIGRDKWAKGQQLVYQYAYSKETLIDNIKNNFGAITKRIDQSNHQKIESTVYQSGVDVALIRDLEDSLNVSLRLPNDYQKAILEQNSFAWVRFDSEDFISNILIKKLPYTDKSQLTIDGLKAVRDSLGRKYISSEIEGSYMKINDIDLPLITRTETINGYYAIEARGIWEIEHDYMGGPFLSYLLHKPSSNELLFVDGFVYAPGEDKRNFMVYLEKILKTIKY